MDLALEKLKDLFSDLRGSAVFNHEDRDTVIYPQDFVVFNMSIFSLCSNGPEINLRDKIASSLRKCNCLFYLSNEFKALASIRIAIASFKRKGIIYTTETTGIYIANPYYIRRGEILSVLLTTIKEIENHGLSRDSIMDKKKIKIQSELRNTG